jgi:PKD repeat protein
MRGLSIEEAIGRRGSGRLVVSMLVGVLAGVACLLAAPSLASAGTYPMHQCAPGTPAVSPGWSVYGYDTDASSVLSNTCSSGGAIGDSVASNEQAGAVTENGHMGSQVGLQINVPGSAPDVTIQSITAEVIGSSVTGDDAFVGFSSAGQALPGAVEIPNGGGSNYTASDSWTLPQGARDFEAHVNCSTDDSSPTCYFADSIAVPALSDITLTLEDNTPPVIKSASGPLATAAADKSTVAGSQTLSFTAGDADSGVRSATLTLTPQDGETPYTHTFDFAAQCSYDSWNACPLTESVSEFALNTATLKEGSYTVNLTVTDAAGNTASDSLGTITVAGSPGSGGGSTGGSTGGSGGLSTPIGSGSPLPSVGPDSPAAVRGPANGANASDQATLTARWASTAKEMCTSGYGAADRITGRLTAPGGVPISGASIEVFQTPAEQGAQARLSDTGVRTGPTGEWTLTLPRDVSSSTLRFAYLSHLDDTIPAATATLTLRVRAGIALRIAPRVTSVGRKIFFSGVLHGTPIPEGGKQLVLEASSGGEWIQFNTISTNAMGHYRASYRFKFPGPITYRFRVVSRHEADFPFLAGASNVVGVHER